MISQSLLPDVLSAIHDDATSGHLGFIRTVRRTQERLYWHKIRDTIKQYVSGCEECRRHRRPSNTPPGLLQPLPPPFLPFEQVGIDLMGSFRRSSNDKNRWVIVCVDHLTRYAETAAVPSSTATCVATFLLRFFILRHGSPRVIISHCGRQLVADAVEELLGLCCSKFRHSTPYHPETNGLVKLMKGTLTNMQALYVSSDHKDWDDMLPFITYAYNTAKHETTDYSPFYLLYARLLLSSIDTILPFDFRNEYLVAKTLWLAEEVRRTARLRPIASQHRYKERYDSRHRSVLYSKGEFVWAWTTTA